MLDVFHSVRENLKSNWKWERKGMFGFNGAPQPGANWPELYRQTGPLAECIAMWSSSCGRAPRAWKIEIFRGLVIPLEEKIHRLWRSRMHDKEDQSWGLMAPLHAMLEGYEAINVLHLHPANYRIFSDQPEIPHCHGLVQSLPSPRAFPIPSSLYISLGIDVLESHAHMKNCE